jgi:hypothetical protein
LERLGARVDELEARIKELEERRPEVAGYPISISAKYALDYDSTRVGKKDELNWRDRSGYARFDITTERQIDENWKAALNLIWVSGAAAVAEVKEVEIAGEKVKVILKRETDGLAIRQLNLQGKVDLPIFGETPVTVGRQYVKFGHGFLLDTNFAGVDGVRVDAKKLWLNWTFVAADIPTGTAFTDYYDGNQTDGMFGVRASRSFLGKERLKLGASWLYTGQKSYKAYGADLALRLLGGSILPEVRAEWVYSYRDPDNNRARGNLYHIEADILKTNRIDLILSYTDASYNYTDASKRFSLQEEGPAIYNPFYITTTEQLFLRPVAFGAKVTWGNTSYLLRDNVIDIRADLKIFGKSPISLRWFTGDALGGNQRPNFGDVFTVAYRGWKIGPFALDVVYGNKSAIEGDTQKETKRQYVGVAASASF